MTGPLPRSEMTNRDAIIERMTDDLAPRDWYSGTIVSEHTFVLLGWTQEQAVKYGPQAIERAQQRAAQRHSKL